MGAPRGEFEWIVDFATIRAFFDPSFLQVPIGRALVVGCGRSALSKELAAVFQEVVSVDCELAVVEAMREAEPQLQWVCADCCSQEAMGPILEAGGPFDAVIDKGTLDAVMCEEDMAASLLRECYRALKPGGVYLCVSLRGRSLLDRIFGPGGPWDWSYEAFPISTRKTTIEARVDEADCAPEFTMVALRRPSSTTRPVPELAVVRAHCEEALDSFFAEESPMLTPEREEVLRRAFGAAALPLAEAYQALFSGAERDEYQLEDFLEDAAASADSRADPERMGADEAVEFLRANQ